MMARLVGAVIVTLILLGSLGCNQSVPSATIATSRPQPLSAPTVQPIREGTVYRDVILPGRANLTWIEPSTAGGGWSDSQAARAAVQEAIAGIASQLASIDYSSLALPDFVTTTRSLTLSEATFNGDNLIVEAYAEDAQGNRWAVYGWKGPEIPPLAGRPLVHRWVYVYALYDIAAGKVTRMLPTISGEVHE